MEFALASAIGVLASVGVYLTLRARTFDVILGMTFLSYATNLLIFSSGRLAEGKPPVLREGVAAELGNYTDPLPQALVLTAIVIAFAMTAVSIVLAMRNRGDNGSDHVDASADDQEEDADRQRGGEDWRAARICRRAAGQHASNCAQVLRPSSGDCAGRGAGGVAYGPETAPPGPLADPGRTRADRLSGGVRNGKRIPQGRRSLGRARKPRYSRASERTARG